MDIPFVRYATTAAHPFRSRLPAVAGVGGVGARLLALETASQRWLIAHSIAILRVSVGAVFLAFGALKLFPGVSPAQNLVESTTDILTLGLIPGSVALVGVAIVECLIGLLLISGRAMRSAVYLLGVQLIGILSPLVLLTGSLFAGPHGAPTLAGQYVLKDIIIVAVALVLAATIRGGRLTAAAEGQAAQRGSAVPAQRDSRTPGWSAPAPARAYVTAAVAPIEEAA